jgi:hypothetical protein
MAAPLPAGARWCDRHGRLECARQRSRGRGQCHGPAVRGTDRCRAHLGVSVEQARRQVLTAWAAMPGDGGITPADAVMGMLGLSWRRADLLGELLRQQADGAGSGGLTGHTYSASPAAGGVYPTGERVRALAELERAERELCAKLAETAHRMGIEEARVRLAARYGDELAAYTRRLLVNLGLDGRDEQVGAAVAAAARWVAGRG